MLKSRLPHPSTSLPPTIMDWRSTKSGIFPSSHVQPLEWKLDAPSTSSGPKTSGNSGKSEASQLIDEITETVKIWWSSLKNRYANECSPESSCDKFVQYIKDLMIIRNKIRSGNVPTGELKEIRLVIARKIDAGNHCMGLGMHIRNSSGKVIRADQLSVVNAYKQHESALSRITCNDFFGSNFSAENAHINKYAVLLDVGNFCAEFASTAHTFELVICVINGRTREVLSEPLTMYWSRATRAFSHDSRRALFVDFGERELKDDQLVMSLDMLRHSPAMEQGGKKAGEVLVPTSHQLRQVFASGNLNISDQLRDVMDKEKREITFNLLRELMEWQGGKLQSQNSVGNGQSSPSSKLLNGMTGSGQANLIYDQSVKVGFIDSKNYNGLGKEMPNRRILMEGLRSDRIGRSSVVGKQRSFVEDFLFDDYMENDLMGRKVKRNPRIHSSRYPQDSMEEDDFLTDQEEDFGRNRRRRSHPESRPARVQYKYIRVPVYPQERRSRRSRSLAYEDIPRRPRAELRQTIRRSNSFKQSSRPSFVSNRSPRIGAYRDGGNGFAGNARRLTKGAGVVNVARDGKWRHDKFKGETQKRRMTPEELDKELEAYMKTSKHPRVEGM
uniref:Chromatin target of PRMT1 protein C-terminal domain-containing protein n=1 Tax=Ditylenchus dipsaci TaxID=166011 RepID=A0A915DYA7_9BILA